MIKWGSSVGEPGGHLGPGYDVRRDRMGEILESRKEISVLTISEPSQVDDWLK